MKNIFSLKRNLMLVGIIFLLGIFSAFGQEKVIIAAGFGLPEHLNIGIRYQLSQSQIGMSVGTHKDGITVTTDYFQNFAGSSKFSDRRPFYTRLGFTYLRDEGEIFLDQYLILALRIGRDFNLSEKIGIQLDLGAFFDVLHHETKKVDYDYGPGASYDIFIPAFGITLFYRV